jgi:hypothetical protein
MSCKQIIQNRERWETSVASTDSFEEVVSLARDLDGAPFALQEFICRGAGKDEIFEVRRNFFYSEDIRPRAGGRR